MNPCVVCFKETKRHCSGCKIAYYCSRSCQEKDWSLHKKECQNKATDYDASVLCNQLVGKFMNSREARDQFATLVRKRGSGAHGIVLRFHNAHEVRLALGPMGGRFKTIFLTAKEQYANTPPVSFTGVRPGLDYVLVIEVAVPNRDNLYASVGMAVPFDFDEPGQMHTFV